MSIDNTDEGGTSGEQKQISSHVFCVLSQYPIQVIFCGVGSAFKILLGMSPFLSALTGCLKGLMGQGPNT